MKRALLLISYVLLFLHAFIQSVALSVTPGQEYAPIPFSFSYYFPVILLALVFILHHMVSFFYLRKNGGIVLTQVFFILMDLVYVLYSQTTLYFTFKEFIVSIVIGLRFISLLAFIGHFELHADN